MDGFTLSNADFVRIIFKDAGGELQGGSSGPALLVDRIQQEHGLTADRTVSGLLGVALEGNDCAFKVSEFLRKNFGKSASNIDLKDGMWCRGVTSPVVEFFIDAARACPPDEPAPPKA